MKINNINNQQLNITVPKKPEKDSNDIEVKDQVELGKNIDYKGIISGTAGALAGGAGIGYLGAGTGVALGLMSNLVFFPASAGEAIVRASTGGIIGGVTGLVAGGILGAFVGKTICDYATGKKSLKTTLENTSVARPGNKSDNFDKFEGINLKFIRIGEFSEGPKTTQTQEKVKTSDVINDANRKAKDQIKTFFNHGTIKPDINSVQINPETTATTVIIAKETFKGVAIGKNLKIGKSHLEESKTTAYKADFSFKAKIEHPYADINTTMSSQIAELAPSIQKEEDKTIFLK